MEKKLLALFDLDGTLFDTSDVNYCAYRDALAPFAVELDREYFRTFCNGRHYTEFLPKIMGTTGHMEEVHKLKKSAYAANLPKARANTHLFQMIQAMAPVYHLAVVTTASRQNATDILRHFGYGDLFSFLVTQENITRVKPDPQGFLLAMAHFGMDAAHTVIFEDSPVGIQAARATGATVMVVDQF